MKHLLLGAWLIWIAATYSLAKRQPLGDRRQTHVAPQVVDESTSSVGADLAPHEPASPVTYTAVNVDLVCLAAAAVFLLVAGLLSA